MKIPKLLFIYIFAKILKWLFASVETTRLRAPAYPTYLPCPLRRGWNCRICDALTLVSGGSCHGQLQPNQSTPNTQSDLGLRGRLCASYCGSICDHDSRGRHETRQQ